MTNTGLGFGVLGPLLMTSYGVRVPVGAPNSFNVGLGSDYTIFALREGCPVNRYGQR